MKERRSLKMHRKLLLDVISRQAGTLDKAILEGVMNSIEAMQASSVNNPHVDITFTPSANGCPAHLRIQDSGRGFTSRAEIEEFFDHFGAPHTADETVIWKQFRMGRGQLFSFGVNTWRTGTFRMVVDVANWGLDYELEDGMQPVKGCVIDIDLYTDPIGSSYASLKALQQAVLRQVEFISVPVLFNGENLSKDPTKLKWDSQDEFAYYSLSRGDTGLLVYNLGAFCKSVAAFTHGASGIVVSKQLMKVNFARNDIQHDCPVWRHIIEVLRKRRAKMARGSPRRLTEDDRIAALCDLRDGVQGYKALSGVSLLSTTSGRKLTLQEILRSNTLWTFAARNDPVADRILQRKQALCIDRSVLLMLGYEGDPSMFFKWLLESHGGAVADKAQNFGKLYRPLDTLSAGLRMDAKLLAPEDLKMVEKRFIKILEGFDSESTRWGQSKQGGLLCGRRVFVGISDLYDAWTDGVSYVAFGRDFLTRIWFNPALVMATLAHEICHDSDDTTNHAHNEEFYRKYHDLATSDTRSNPLTWIASFQAASDSLRRAERREKKALAEKKIRDKLMGKKSESPVAASVS